VSLFKKKSSEFDDQENQSTGKSKGSLLVLLVLLAGFAYLYFFTSLIVPHEAPPATAPDVSTEVKQSMPPKPAAPPANPATTEANKPAEVNPAASPASPAPSPAQPVVPPVAAPATVKPAAPPAVAPASVKPAAPAPQPPAAAKPANLPPVPAAPKKEAAAPLKKDEPKPAKAAEQKSAPAVAKKAAAGSAKAPAPEKPVVRKKPASYTIFAGEFAAGEETAAAEAKLARLDIKPVTRQETKKSKSMNRLFFGVYTEYDEYSAALGKLKQTAKGAFGVEKDGKYYLYAGSFAAKERVEKEKKELAAKGVTLQTQLVILPLSTVRLTAGKFASKGEADKAAARMKGEGLAVKVVQLGR